MLKEILYFIVIIFANTIGSISGMGGGVIIKPAFDFIALDSVATISFYSTVAVFVMSSVSTVRQVQSGVKLEFSRLLYLALGSLLGGYLGSLLFDGLLALTNDGTAQLTQIVITILVLVFSLLASKNYFKSYQLQGIFWYVTCGIILGLLSSFLGIGGGPINVSLFMILFSVPIKLATVYSIATIFFSQLSKILSLMFVVHFNHFDWSVLVFVVCSAILGGILGAKCSKVLSEDKVVRVFQVVVLAVLTLNGYNLYTLIVG
ncbi:hypothetical protein SORDD05_01430 [Streptococcus oralis]|uniref:Probable membrane transporter protein n=1 Tax=Streptococcus oralis TaxID=1303 RepID=A0A139M894_STROR|nr:sulfite exporter TauE/SafE family protein [Streptococcus oralis]KXT59923.1 hypothetical protein SORDD05_01430 [Streptococcus oralis]